MIISYLSNKNKMSRFILHELKLHGYPNSSIFDVGEKRPNVGEIE